MRRLATRVWQILALAALALVPVACALPVDDEPRDLSLAEHAELIGGETTTTTTNQLVLDTTNVVLYFVGADGQLRTVRRAVAEPNVKQILDELENQPTEVELEEFPDLISRLNPAFEAKTLGRLDRENEPGLLTIEVSPLLQEVASNDSRQAREAVTQMVCTITNLTFIDNPIPISSVAIIDTAGNPLSITDDEASAVDSPFSNSDFNDCEVADDGVGDVEVDASNEEP